MEAPQSPPVETRPQKRLAWFWLVIALWMTASIGAMVYGTVADQKLWLTIGSLALIGVTPFPFVAIAQQGEWSERSRFISLISWGIALFCACGLVVLFVAAACLDNGELKAGSSLRISIAVLLSAMAMLAGVWGYSAGGRRIAAKWLPINPYSFTSATGLAVALPAVMLCLTPLAVTGRIPMQLSNTDVPKEIESFETMASALIAQLVWLVVFAVVAGGFPVLRSFRETMSRLGVGPIHLSTIGVAICIAVAMVGCVIPLEHSINRIWQWLGWPTTDEKSTEQLLLGMKSWYGAIIVGLVAGISEELLVRGLLQPRLGLVLSNLLFASAHAFQYHWDGVLIVFAIGIVCGLVRQRYNTTTAMIVHGLYDTILVLIVTYFGDLPK